MEFIDDPKIKEETSYRTHFIDLNNLFWQFFFQSSNTLFNKYVECIKENLESKILSQAQYFYCDFL